MSTQLQNHEEIKLAHDTIKFLGDLKANGKIPEGKDVLSIVASLCEWQERWANPLWIPLLGRYDFEGRLDTPKPFEALKSFGFLVAVPSHTGEIAPDQGILGPDNVVYYFVGKKLWQKKVDNGELPKLEVPFNPTVFRWLKDFFELLADIQFSEEEHEVVKSMAGVWFYTASISNFDESDEEALEDEDNEISNMLRGLSTNGGDSFVDDDEEDGDYETEEDDYDEYYEYEEEDEELEECEKEEGGEAHMQDEDEYEEEEDDIDEVTKANTAANAGEAPPPMVTRSRRQKEGEQFVEDFEDLEDADEKQIRLAIQNAAKKIGGVAINPLKHQFFLKLARTEISHADPRVALWYCQN